MASLKGAVEITKFKSPGKDKFYSLELDWKKKTSTLEMWEINYRFSSTGWHPTTLMEFPKIIPEITPQNATDKMKLYILFS